jgi:ATP-binding cassette subfamily F protein 3
MGFGEHSLFKHINVELERGQRVFLLGANGAGKTTLLRLILGLETPTQGQISMGSTVEMGYFSQHQLETLDPNATALESLEAVAPNTMDQTEIRGILGRFLFSGDQVYKPVHVLSGGEKSRLALARLILGGANFLLLDEPTNHMDIPAQTAMEEAFKKYEGSMLCISHDRYLIQQVATHIWELHEGHLIQYEGDYTFYLEKRDERRAMALQHKKMKAKPVKVSPAKPVPPSTDNSRGEQEKRFKQLEKEIMTQETILKNLHQAIEDASYQQEFSQFQELSLRLKTEENTLQTLNQEWETLAALLANPAAFS